MRIGKSTKNHLTESTASVWTQLKEQIKVRKSSLRILFLLIAIASTASLPTSTAGAADQEQPKSELTSDVKLNLSFRYRYEFVDQDGIAENASASTLRTRLAYRSPYFSNFGFLVEFDDISSIGNDLYNSTRNGNTNRPIVADPEGTEVNQAMILYRGIENTVIRAGRQRITLDKHRFIGNVGWRFSVGDDVHFPATWPIRLPEP